MKHSFTPSLRRILCLALSLMALLSLLPLSALAKGTAGVTTAKVVLRKEASKNAKALQTLPKGDEVTILSQSGDWYKVNYGKYTGYVMKKYVRANGSVPTSSSGSSTASDSSSAKQKIKALGSAPGIMRVGDENSDVKKLQQALQILGYYSGKIDGKYGKGTTAAVQAYQKAHKLTADGSAGELTIKSIFGSVSSKSLTTQPAPGSSSSGSSSSSSSSKYKTVSSISEIGSAPGKTQKGDSGSDVVKIQQALECLGYYSGSIDGVYGESTVAAVKKFQSKRGMKADGIAGAGTIRVLFGSNASTSASSSGSTTPKTEVPDWYADNVSKLIPKNAHFTIKDVKTGKTFNAVRWSGGDHMDTEPASSADTAVIKSIYGGSFSWKRRPILIKYNGHVYAASMNGMPHGTTTISNGFDGHFCIHFKNSKTHGTDKVDAEHQNCVTQAGKATW